jgi:hypothetical protein
MSFLLSLPPDPSVCRDPGQMLRERLRARPHLPHGQGFSDFY